MEFVIYPFGKIDNTKTFKATELKINVEEGFSMWI